MEEIKALLMFMLFVKKKKKKGNDRIPWALHFHSMYTDP